MSLTAGTRIGPFEVKSPLGEGGMGIVYRARDTQLQRDVAIKLLPEHFAKDPDRLARFQREGQVLASLNHPNIAQIYGLEGTGATRCIVMELVDGDTLQERLKRGPIPLDEALPIAKQIAEALEAAHEKGVTHDGRCSGWRKVHCHSMRLSRLRRRSQTRWTKRTGKV